MYEVNADDSGHWVLYEVGDGNFLVVAWFTRKEDAEFAKTAFEMRRARLQRYKMEGITYGNTAVTVDARDDFWQPTNVYRIHVLISKDEHGGYSAVALNLPGVGSCGDTVEEAIENAKVATRAAIESYQADGKDIPWQDSAGMEIPFGTVQKWIIVGCSPMTPRYIHDCERCLFLGHFAEFDLYFADHGGAASGYEPSRATVLARHGNDRSEYVSGLCLADTVPAIGEARRLAVERGLLRPLS